MRYYYQEVLELATHCGGLDVPVMWSDIETYHDWSEGVTIPDVVEVLALVDEAAKAGMQAGFYSSPPMWRLAGNPPVGPDAWGWCANYTQTPPTTLAAATPFGGLKMVGHQFTSTPLDQNVFIL